MLEKNAARIPSGSQVYVLHLRYQSDISLSLTLERRSSYPLYFCLVVRQTSESLISFDSAYLTSTTCSLDFSSLSYSLKSSSLQINFNFSSYSSKPIIPTN